MSKHTAGPWKQIHKIIDAENGRHGRDITERICIMDDGPTEEERNANARLIAAAPELLGALKEARSVLETASRYFPKSIQNTDRFNLLNVLANSVNPVIAKAEGRE